MHAPELSTQRSRNIAALVTVAAWLLLMAIAVLGHHHWLAAVAIIPGAAFAWVCIFRPIGPLRGRHHTT